MDLAKHMLCGVRGRKGMLGRGTCLDKGPEGEAPPPRPAQLPPRLQRP